MPTAETPARRLGETILDRIAPEAIDELDQRELIGIVATIYGDVELASVLYGTEEFFWERLLHWSERGYLTAQEDQGTRRLLALAYRRQLRSMLGRAGDGQEFEFHLDEEFVETDD